MIGLELVYNGANLFLFLGCSQITPEFYITCILNEECICLGNLLYTLIYYMAVSLTRTENYQVYEFDSLKSIWRAV